jgi:hypothetical protein
VSISSAVAGEANTSPYDYAGCRRRFDNKEEADAYAKKLQIKCFAKKV